MSGSGTRSSPDAYSKDRSLHRVAEVASKVNHGLPEDHKESDHESREGHDDENRLARRRGWRAVHGTRFDEPRGIVNGPIRRGRLAARASPTEQDRETNQQDESHDCG